MPPTLIVQTPDGRSLDVWLAGPHALACAALIPERVLGTAIIAGVAPYPADGLDWLEGMGAENVEEFGRTLEGEAAIVPFVEKAAAELRDVKPEDLARAFGDLIDDVDRGAVPGRVHIWQGAHDRMIPFGHGQWLAAHCGGACVHLHEDQGHLSLVVDRFGDVLDELVAGAA